MKKIIFIALITINSFSLEISAFKAGDIESETPYGLTENEQIYFRQKQELKSIHNILLETNQEQSQIREELEGVKSLLSGISEKNQKISNKISKHSEEINNLNKEITDLKAQISFIETKLEENFKLQNTNYDEILKTLEGLTKIIDKHSENFSIIEKKIPLTKDISISKVDKNISKVDKNISTIDKDLTENNIINKNVVELENYLNAGKIEKAIEILNSPTFVKNNKKSTIKYFYGEISFYKKEFKKAIKYYQDSMELESNNFYTPILLYHTALCLKEMNDKKNMKKMLETLIKTYPNHYIVKEAIKLI